MSAWTPGPWRIKPVALESYVDIIADSETCGLASVFGEEEYDRANARLIAAAPDLYEALFAALPYLVAVQETFDERGRDVVLRATAALARVPS